MKKMLYRFCEYVLGRGEKEVGRRKSGVGSRKTGVGSRELRGLEPYRNQKQMLHSTPDFRLPTITLMILLSKGFLIFTGLNEYPNKISVF